MAPGASIKKVPADQKIGLYIKLGKAPGAPVVAGKVKDLDNKQKEKLKAGWVNVPPEAQKIVEDYIPTSGARAMNTALRSGAPTVHGMPAAAFVKMAQQAAQPIDPGTKFYRTLSSKGGAGQKAIPKDAWDKMIAEIKASQPGTVIQGPGFSSTSFGDSVFGGELEWRFTTAPGAKGLFAYAGPGLGGEKEMIFPPGSRYMIQGWKEVGGKLYVDAVVLPLD